MSLCDILLEEVTVSFGEHVILKNLSIHVKEGETLVLIGPSGMGKSVLLKTMAGLISPDRGRVVIGGENLATLTPSQLKAKLRSMGMLFQKNALFDSLTVGENLAFPLREATTLLEADIQARVRHFLEEVGIAHAEALFPDEISGGMQKRLGIARALALEPKIIFYDDPTAGLDPITSRKIIQLIMKLQKETHATVVSVTNDMNRAYQMADRIAMIVDQELILGGSVEETKAHRDPRVQNFIRGIC